MLLGHTRDDQAETVLLALARGAGPRGLSGMPAADGDFRRPLLDVARADTRKACAALGLVPWDDPHNTDPAYARSRVRATALPALVAALGPAVVGNLARTAALIAADNAALDELAAGALASRPVARPGLSVAGAGRAARRGPRPGCCTAWARELGAPGGALSHRHVVALDALVTGWHGQGRLPARSGSRSDGREGARVRHRSGVSPGTLSSGPSAHRTSGPVHRSATFMRQA